MPSARDALTPEMLALLQGIARSGSFAAAARAAGLVPSALTYRVRQLEDALDVLLFDRSSRQARLTEAGAELVREGDRLLHDLDALAHRVRRVATGWEARFSISVDSLITRAPLYELCEAFFATGAPTQLRLRDEVLSGTLEALASGQADLAIGVALDRHTRAGIHSKPLGEVRMVYAVAPHHPLAAAPEPLTDDLIRTHRAVAVADSTPHGGGLTVGLLGGQEVFTVTNHQAKLEAHLRGMGAGFLPGCLAQPHIDIGHLVVKQVARAERHAVTVGYAWRGAAKDPRLHGRALSWWLEQLERPVTRAALLGERSTIPPPTKRVR